MGICPTSRIILTILTAIALVHNTKAADKCLQGVNCNLPDCFCPTFDHPMGAQNIPQIVYFGFDDAVQPQVASYYDKIFTSERKNPNGCPISMTLYISHKYTAYGLVAEYYKKGNEMAAHSVTHRDIDTKAKLLEEAAEQKLNIEQLAEIPGKEITGWRSPNLKTAGDDQPRILKQLDYTYDNSLSYNQDLNYPFPFTLDFGYPYPCIIPPCPRSDSKHEGFWEVMIHSLTDPKTGLPCGYVDGCRPETEADAEEYLWSNFLHAYQTNRAPFGLNMHAAWFAFPGYLPAMEKFVDRLLSLPDVYIVTVEQMLKWMRSPTSLDEIKTFAPWGCNTGTVKRSNDDWLSKHSAPKDVTPPRVIAPVQSYIRNQTSNTPDISKQTTKQPTFLPRETQQPLKDEVSIQREFNSCLQGSNCHLPNCLCKSLTPPKGLSSVSPILQVVFLAVDSTVDGRTFKPLTQIFGPPRRGTNGCRASGSLFLPSFGNYPPYVKALTDAGVRLGVKLDRNHNQRSISADIFQTRANLNAVYGFRSIGLENKVSSSVADSIPWTGFPANAFIVKESIDPSWPFTIDNLSWNRTRCFPGSRCKSVLWQVPISPLQVPGQGRSCVYPKSCPYLFTNAEDTFSVLKYNFYRHYFSTRVPFGISIDESWLTGANAQEKIRGLNLFIDFVLGNPEVAVVSVDRMIDWLSKAGQYGNYLSC